MSAWQLLVAGKTVPARDPMETESRRGAAVRLVTSTRGRVGPMAGSRLPALDFLHSAAADDRCLRRRRAAVVDVAAAGDRRAQAGIGAHPGVAAAGDADVDVGRDQPLGVAA